MRETRVLRVMVLHTSCATKSADLPSLCECADHISTRLLQVFPNEQQSQRNRLLW